VKLLRVSRVQKPRGAEESQEGSEERTSVTKMPILEKEP